MIDEQDFQTLASSRDILLRSNFYPARQSSKLTFQRELIRKSGAIHSLELL